MKLGFICLILLPSKFYLFLSVFGFEFIIIYFLWFIFCINIYVYFFLISISSIRSAFLILMVLFIGVFILKADNLLSTVSNVSLLLLPRSERFSLFFRPKELMMIGFYFYYFVKDSFFYIFYCMFFFSVSSLF